MKEKTREKAIARYSNSVIFWPRAVQRIGLQLQQTALTVIAMPQESRRQKATEFRNAQLSVVSCKPLLGGDHYPSAGGAGKKGDGFRFSSSGVLARVVS